jgi:hypothetical protein
MTPLEKAEELFDKMYILDNRAWYDVAKKCAIIAVDEILKESKPPIITHRMDSYKSVEDFSNNLIHIQNEIDNYVLSNYGYWQQVKNELEKL